MKSFPNDCVCGGNGTDRNPDCERCQMLEEIERLRLDNNRLVARDARIRRSLDAFLSTVGDRLLQIYHDAAKEVSGE